MTFLHPALLYLLPLAAIPILLHLLTLHRLRTVELSTFRFLFDSYVQQRRKMQFLEALLAMLRTLFLLALVLVICRPVVKHWSELFQAGSAREVIMLVDCSASMNTSTGESALDRAKSVARSVVERLHADDRLTLIRVVSKPEEVFSRFTTDVEAIRTRIDELKTSPSRANMFAALMQVFGPEAPKRANPIVYVFTDCQKSGWREVQNQGLERLIPEGTPFIVVNVGSKEPIPNLAIIGSAPRRHRAIVGLPIYLRPTAVNYSKGEPVEATVTVFIDEKEVKRIPMTLKPGEPQSARVTYIPTEPGVHHGRFEIAGKNHEAFPDDDRFLFTLTVQPRIKVLLINGYKAADPSDNESYFLNAALTSSLGDDADKKKTGTKNAADLGSSKEFAKSIEVQEITENVLTPPHLQTAGVVVLANCGTLNAQHFLWLREYVAAGGGLLIFPGDKVNPGLYNDQFFTVPGPQGDQVTAARMGPFEGDPDKVETFERLASIDFSHPVLSVFDDPKLKAFKIVRFYRRFPLIFLGKRENTTTLAEFTTGKPALVESQFGEGMVVLAAFPANTRWTNLPSAGGNEFVPLVKRLVSHVLRRPEVKAPSVVAPDSSAEIAVISSWEPIEGTITDPAGRTRTLKFERSGTWQVSSSDPTELKGYYSVDIKGKPLDQAGHKSAKLAFAVNVAPEESDFVLVGESQLQELLPAAKVTLVDASAEAQQFHGSIGDENEIWRPLIWVMFVIIGVEFTLATLGGHRRQGEEDQTVGERIRDISTGSWIARMTGAARKGAKEG